MASCREKRDEIVKAFAEAIFASAWANAEEEAGRSLSGTEIYDVAPFGDHPDYDAAMTQARKAIGEIENTNMLNICKAYDRAAAKPLTQSWHVEAEPEDFGFSLGMEWLGSGVAWSDDHPEHDLEVPYGEFYIEPTYEDDDEAPPERPDDDELRDAIVLQDAQSGSGYDVYQGRNDIGLGLEWDEAIKAANDYAEREKYWPNFYYINERGNIDLLDSKGNILESWV